MRIGLALALLSLSYVLGHAAPFENLAFDQANTNRVIPQDGAPFRGVGTTEDLLPGWQLSKGAAPQATLGLNLSLLGPGYATLISADQSDSFQFPVEGKYALYLVGSPGNQDPFSISQRGEVPLDARLLTFHYSGYGFVVTADNKPLSAAISTPTMQAFDISAFEGQTIDLKLTAAGPLMPTQSGSTFIDSIAFTVPEPSPLSLALIGVVGICLAFRSRSSKACRRH